MPRNAPVETTRPPVFCAGSPEQATALLRAGDRSGRAGVLSTQSAEFLVATHYLGYREDEHDLRLLVYGSTCDGSFPALPDPFDRDLSSTRMVTCSRMKMYSGYDFTGTVTPWDDEPNTFFSFERGSPEDNNIRSIRYGA